jgi:hypothetical protein
LILEKLFDELHGNGSSSRWAGFQEAKNPTSGGNSYA